MSDAGETVWVVFNGEIYNFEELRAELEAKGHQFRTRSDTEIIIHGYKEWGEGVFDRLNGMFGLAIWDVRERKLVVARDAMGIKPVYYRLDAGSLFFASEVRALVSSSPESISPDPVSLNLFLRYRYTPSPKTLFEGISKLAPGHDAGRQGRLRRGETLVSVRAGAFRQAEVARRQQGGTAAAVQGSARAASDQRRSGRPASERRNRLGPAARADEPLSAAVAHLHRRATAAAFRTTSSKTQSVRRRSFRAITHRSRCRVRISSSRCPRSSRASRSRSPPRPSSRCTWSASGRGRT